MSLTGSEFLTELRATFARIEESPQHYPLVFHECRRAILRRFPFGVFFTVDADVATVLAITHLHVIPMFGKTESEDKRPNNALEPSALG